MESANASRPCRKVSVQPEGCWVSSCRQDELVYVAVECLASLFSSLAQVVEPYEHTRDVRTRHHER